MLAVYLWYNNISWVMYIIQNVSYGAVKKQQWRKLKSHHLLLSVRVNFSVTTMSLLRWSSRLGAIKAFFYNFIFLAKIKRYNGLNATVYLQWSFQKRNSSIVVLCDDLRFLINVTHFYLIF